MRMDDNITLQTKRIKYTVYTAAPEYRDVILHYLPKVRLRIPEQDEIANYNHSIRDIFGRRTISLHLDDTSRGDSAFCHEFGHALDDLVAEDTDKVNYISDCLSDTILDECRDHIKSEIDKCDNLSDTQKTELLDYFFSRENPNVSLENDPKYYRKLLPSSWDLSPELKDAYERVRDYYGYEEYIYLEGDDSVYKTKEKNGIMSRFGCQIILSDMFGGVTNNKVGGMGTHRLKQENKMVDGTPITSDVVKSASDLYECLTDFNYFYGLDKDGNEFLRDSYATEFFAENFDFKMNNKDMKAVYSELGRSSKQFDDLYAKIAADVLGENTNK